jgi:putative FmdB family regulatory protein
MPTYEYACRECGEHLEVVQSFKDDPLTTCLGCGGNLRKVFSATGIIFKGSGYYVTDTRKKATAESGSSKSSSSSSSATSSTSDSSSSAAKSA